MHFISEVCFLSLLFSFGGGGLGPILFYEYSESVTAIIITCDVGEQTKTISVMY